MLLQVYGELIFEAEAVDETVKVVSRTMEGAQLDVPLVVDTGTGPNWDEGALKPVMPPPSTRKERLGQRISPGVHFQFAVSGTRSSE